MDRSTSLPEDTVQLPSHPRFSFICKKTVSLLSPAVSLDTHWLLFLSRLSHRRKVSLNLVQTLVYETSEHAYLCLFPDRDKSIVSLSGADAWDHFFTVSTPGIQPWFLHRTGKGFEVTRNVKKAQQLATELDQSFVLHCFDFEVKARYKVHWTKNGENKVEEEVEFGGAWKQCEELSEEQCKSQFLHDLTVFRHAGQLRKSSFTHFSPFPSVLASTLKQKGHRLPSKSLPISPSAVLVKSPRTGGSGFMAIHARLEIKSIADEVYSCLRTEKRVESFVMTLVESRLDHWYLQDVSNISYEQESPWSPRHISITPAPSHSSRKSLTHLAPLTHNLRRLPFVDMQEVQHKCARLYPSYCPKLLISPAESPRRSEMETTLHDNAVDAATKQLDSVLESVERAKSLSTKDEKFRAVAKDSPGLLLSAVKSAYLSCVTDPVLEHFFQFSSKTSMDSFAGKIVEAITAPRNFHIAAKLHTYHQSFHITNQEFEHFVSKFCSALSAHSDDADIVEALRQRLSWYRSDIVRE